MEIKGASYYSERFKYYIIGDVSYLGERPVVYVPRKEETKAQRNALKLQKKGENFESYFQWYRRIYNDLQAYILKNRADMWDLPKHQGTVVTYNFKKEGQEWEEFGHAIPDYFDELVHNEQLKNVQYFGGNFDSRDTFEVTAVIPYF